MTGVSFIKDTIDSNLAAVKKVHHICRAINHPLRRAILVLIEERGDITVTDIFVHLRLEQSVASQQLAILRRAGLVNTTRDGKYIYYTVNQERYSFIVEQFEKIVNHGY